MFAIFRRIKKNHHVFTADHNGTLYQGSITSVSQGNGKVITSINSSPELGEEQNKVMDSYMRFLKNQK